jgi:hypothetical protein
MCILHDIVHVIGVPSGVMTSSSVLGMSLMKCTALKVDCQVTYMYNVPNIMYM